MWENNSNFSGIVFLSRVAMIREKSLENDFFQVREKSGNFDMSQGNLEKMGKVRLRQSSEKYRFTCTKFYYTVN